MHSKLQHPELPGALAHGARLRRADINDVPHLFTLEQELFPLDAWNLDMFLAEITHPTRTYYVLERAHSGENPQENPDEKNAPNIIGYCGVMTVADTADVQTIAVLPEYEGNGYGRAMLATMHRRAQDLGASFWRCGPIIPEPRTSTCAPDTRIFTHGPAIMTTARMR